MLCRRSGARPGMSRQRDSRRHLKPSGVAVQVGGEVLEIHDRHAAVAAPLGEGAGLALLVALVLRLDPESRSPCQLRGLCSPALFLSPKD
jgi:hypothetical protein